MTWRVSSLFTPRKTNMEPENRTLEKELEITLKLWNWGVVRESEEKVLNAKCSDFWRITLQGIDPHIIKKAFVGYW